MPKKCTPYQLRRGGPSADRRDSVRSLQGIKQRGRWIADSSMRRYEAAARLQKEEAVASLVLLASFRSVAARLPGALVASMTQRPECHGSEASPLRS